MDGIPVTTVARTLLDLADVLDLQALRRAITEAEYRNLFDLTALIAVVESNPGSRTTKLMTAATEGRLHRTRSPLEDRFLRFVDRYGVEEPESNVRLEGYEVDFLWRRVGLVVELDGLAEHGTRAGGQAGPEEGSGALAGGLQDDAADRRCPRCTRRRCSPTSLRPASGSASWPRASS